MASLDTDVTMVPAGEGPNDAPPSASGASASSSSKKPKRFEIKKWNPVALWAWGTISWISALSVKLIKLVPQARNVLLLGVKNVAMEKLDFYDSHKMISEERINAAMNKLPFRP